MLSSAICDYHLQGQGNHVLTDGNSQWDDIFSLVILHCEGGLPGRTNQVIHRWGLWAYISLGDPSPLNTSFSFPRTTAVTVGVYSAGTACPSRWRADRGGGRRESAAYATPSSCQTPRRTSAPILRNTRLTEAEDQELRGEWK
jgi:hypothetical protein